MNPLAAKTARDAEDMINAGMPEAEAHRRAGFRVFGSKPGAYGAGLQALIDEKGWDSDADLANAYVTWGGYAYGAGAEGDAEQDLFRSRLGAVQAVIHNQDNREHDLLDSDDYYQFEGGLTAAVRVQSGNQPSVYHNDHSRPERPVVRALDDEIARIVRGPRRQSEMDRRRDAARLQRGVRDGGDRRLPVCLCRHRQVRQRSSLRHGLSGVLRRRHRARLFGARKSGRPARHRHPAFGSPRPRSLAATPQHNARNAGTVGTLNMGRVYLVNKIHWG